MRHPNMSNILMTVEELAKYLKIKPDTIYKKVKRGELPALKLGKLLRFPKELIDEWVIEQATKTMKDVKAAKQAVEAKVEVAFDEVKKTARTAGQVIDQVRHAPLNKKQETLNKGLKKLLKEVDQGIKKLTPKPPRARAKTGTRKVGTTSNSVRRKSGAAKSVKTAANPETREAVQVSVTTLAH